MLRCGAHICVSARNLEILAGVTISRDRVRFRNTSSSRLPSELSMQDSYYNTQQLRTWKKWLFVSYSLLSVSFLCFHHGLHPKSCLYGHKESFEKRISPSRSLLRSIMCTMWRLQQEQEGQETEARTQANGFVPVPRCVAKYHSYLMYHTL